MALLQAGTASLEQWVLAQRWYAGKGTAPQLREIGSWNLPGDAETEARVALLLDVSGSRHELYQVPLTLRSRRLADREQSLIAVTVSEDGTERYLYDGMPDPLFARQLLDLIAEGRFADGSGASAAGIPLNALEPAPMTSELLRGEQSNTSVVFRFERDEPGALAHAPSGVRPTSGGRPHAVVCKLFRILQPGANPDVELQSALTAAGSLHVPETIGSVLGQWPDPASGGALVSGHLAFAQVFVEGARDAWTSALESAGAGGDFREIAAEIGRTIAEVHDTLARAIPSRPTTTADIAAIQSAWHRRLSLAIDEVPQLARHRLAISRVYDLAAAVDWPVLQRIHGDLHLGQVLITPDGGCVLIDFEGEPIRPIRERSQADLALRDVAGMLRSFDYVAGALPSPSPEGGWTSRSRSAFLDGYLATSGEDLRVHGELLNALELDKAVYEALYESRHRPTWLPIPLEAIGRLVERSGGAA